MKPPHPIYSSFVNCTEFLRKRIVVSDIAIFQFIVGDFAARRRKTRSVLAKTTTTKSKIAISAISGDFPENAQLANRSQCVAKIPYRYKNCYIGWGGAIAIFQFIVGGFAARRRKTRSVL